MFQLSCSLEDLMGIPLIFGLSTILLFLSKEVPMEKFGKGNISCIFLCNDFLIMLSSKVNSFEHCAFLLVYLSNSFLKSCLKLVSLKFLHSRNL
jgi:hypothetical protein